MERAWMLLVSVVLFLLLIPYYYVQRIWGLHGTGLGTVVSVSDTFSMRNFIITHDDYNDESSYTHFSDMPWWTFTELSVAEGEPATLPCFSFKSAKPVTWVKNGELVAELDPSTTTVRYGAGYEGRVKESLDWDSTGSVSISFESVQLEDAGVFICHARGGDGKTEPVAVRLRVKPQPNITIRYGSDQTTDTLPGQTTDTPPGQITDTPPGQATDTPPGQATDTPPGQITDTPADQTTDTPPGQITDTPPGQITDTPADQTTDMPADQTTDTPPGQITDTPPGQTTDTPPGQATDTPPPAAQDQGTTEGAKGTWTVVSITAAVTSVITAFPAFWLGWFLKSRRSTPFSSPDARVNGGLLPLKVAGGLLTLDVPLGPLPLKLMLLPRKLSLKLVLGILLLKLVLGLVPFKLMLDLVPFKLMWGLVPFKLMWGLLPFKLMWGLLPFKLTLLPLKLTWGFLPLKLTLGLPPLEWFAVLGNWLR